MKKNLTLIIIFLLVGFFLINQPSKILKLEEIKYVQIAGQSVEVDLALTEIKKTKGLAGRNNLSGDSGMLFVFDEPGEYNFWMEGMNFPIDIIWLGEDLKVVYIKKNAQPENYPETYSPNQNAKYILEVIAGFSDKYNLKAGDSVLFTK